MANVTFDSLKKEISNRNFAPVYLLMGEEAYFIDQLTELLLEKVLTEAEKDFNLLTFYGVDSDVNTIVTAARRFPMMAEYQLIVVKEAQELNKFELLDSYVKNPLKSTVLVINYKHGTVDKRKAVIKHIEKNGGVVFESKKWYENQVPAFIKNYFSGKNILIDEKSAQMITDFVGNDISKLIQQLQKLEVSLPESSNRVTSELIEKNVGISKDYNNFELLKAIAEKNILKAQTIVDYFGKNQKDNPNVVTLSVLFNYFSNLLECFWLPQKSEKNVMSTLNLKSPFFARDYMTGLRNYNATQVMEIITHLRTFDGKSKGIDNLSASPGELLKELVYKIMH